MEKKSTASIGVCDILLVVFIVLKLIGVIDWSWCWVLAPLWIPILLALVIVFFVWIS